MKLATLLSSLGQTRHGSGSSGGIPEMPESSCSHANARGASRGWGEWLWSSMTQLWTQNPWSSYPRAALLWIVWTYCRWQSKFQILQHQWNPHPNTTSNTTANTTTILNLSRKGNGGDGGAAAADLGEVASRCHIHVGASFSWTLQNYRRQNVRDMVMTTMTKTCSVPMHSLLTRFYVDYAVPVVEEEKEGGEGPCPSVATATRRRTVRVFFCPQTFLRHLEDGKEDDPQGTSPPPPPPQIFMVMYYARPLQASPNEVPVRLWWTAQDTATYVHAGNHLFTREMVFEMLLRRYKATPDKVAEVWRPDEYELQVFSTGMQLCLRKHDYLEVECREGVAGARVLVFEKRSAQDPDMEEVD